jgi:hypothetical protein
MQDKTREKSQYYALCITEFARQKKISVKKAFQYLDTYKGIEFLVECYDAEHTLSLNNAIDDLTLICQNNGGGII